MTDDQTLPEADRSAPEPPTIHIRRRLTVSEAAAELGISAEAVRSRVKRGTLRSTKEGGTFYVLLPAPVSDDRTRPGDDQTTREGDRARDQTPPEHGRADYRDELLEELRDRVRYLEEANRENRRIIAGLIQRVPELESPQGESHAPETASETPEGIQPQPTGSKRRRQPRRRRHKDGAAHGGVGSLASKTVGAGRRETLSPAATLPQSHLSAAGLSVAYRHLVTAQDAYMGFREHIF